jgi:hypothetical protein
MLWLTLSFKIQSTVKELIEIKVLSLDRDIQYNVQNKKDKTMIHKTLHRTPTEATLNIKVPQQH